MHQNLKKKSEWTILCEKNLIIDFFSITLDQAHEQNTELMKRRWWTNEPYWEYGSASKMDGTGSKVARVINELESAQEQIKKNYQSKESDVQHHEQVRGRHNTFAKHVKTLCTVVDDMGNPVNFA